MEKETLISNLKAKVGENDFGVLSERTVDNIVEQFMPMFAEDDKVTDETYNIPVALLKSYAGQYRHDVKEGIGKGVAEGKSAWETEQKSAQEKAIADAVAKAKEEWEKGIVKKPAEKVTEKDIATLVAEQVKEQMKGITGEDSEFGKLSKQFSDYLKAQSEKEKAMTVAKVKSELKDYLIGLGADEGKPQVIDLALEKLEVGENPVISDLQKLAKAKYEEVWKVWYSDGGKPFAGVSAGFNGGSESDGVKDFLKQQAEKDKADASYADVMKQFLQ